MNQDERASIDLSGLEHLARPFERAEATAKTGLKHALLYLRVSSERQLHTAVDIDADGNSIATQRDTTRKKMTELGATLLKEFVEPGHSAQTIEKRPVFRAMLQYIDEHPEIDYVIIYMRSRVFRNFTDAAITERALLQKGVKLVSAREDFADDYMGDAMRAITDIMNEVQVRQSGEDIKVKMRHKAASGGTVGRAKLGYLNVRKSFDGRLVNTVEIDAERASLVRWAFEAYATGDYTLVQLGSELADQGLTTRPTRRWKAQPVSRSQLAQILKDPYYVGVIRYKGELFPGRHEALITKQLFLRVQDVLAERAKRGQRDRVHHHPFKGLTFCGHCRDRGRVSRMVFCQVESKGRVYDYFLCRGKQDGVCSMPYVAAAEIERELERSVARLSLSPAFTSALRRELDEALSTLRNADHDLRRRLQKQRDELEVKEHRLLDLAAEADLDTDTLKKRLQEVVLQRSALDERLSQTNEQLQQGRARIDVYLDLLERPGDLYDRAPDSVRRQLIEAFFVEHLITIDETGADLAAEGVMVDSVARLHRAEKHYFVELHSAAPETAKSPSLSTGALALSCLALMLRAPVSSKDHMVAGTGFEPATSGL